MPKRRARSLNHDFKQRLRKPTKKPPGVFFPGVFIIVKHPIINEISRLLRAYVALHVLWPVLRAYVDLHALWLVPAALNYPK